MNENEYKRFFQMETTPEALAASAAYLAQKLGAFVRKREPVLICFPKMGPDSLGAVFENAILALDAVPIFWGPDFRWKELLRIAFDSHSQTIIAHPLIVMGLMKIAKATQTPLYIHNVVLGGYPYAQWMTEDLKKGLDAKIWGFYSVRSSPVILGFTCDQQAGIHVREEVVHAMLVEQSGAGAASAKRGKLLFASQKDPQLVLDPHETAILHYQPCSCGSDTPRIVDTMSCDFSHPSRDFFEKRLLDWSSILDYRLRVTEYGTDLEIVIFPGELLPKLPSSAKLTLRPWNPEKDVPFYILDHFVKIPEKCWQQS